MSRKTGRIIFALAVMASVRMTAYAETSYGAPDWQVAFTAENRMESNFGAKDLDDVIYGMQPGDTVIITLALTNQNSAATDWYMTNKVLSSLEDSANAANGGAYTYILAYTGPDGRENVLFSSDTVGGDTAGAAGEGLHEATNSLEDYFFLDTLSSGQSGGITLEVSLDGETQGNGYQDTLADLQMNFAVELNALDTSDDPDTPADPSRSNNPNSSRFGMPTSGRRTAGIVQTGDDTDLMQYVVLCGVSGLLLLVYGCCGLQWRRREQREGRR